MDAIILIFLFLILFVLVLPIAAILKASTASTEVKRLRRQLENLEATVRAFGTGKTQANPPTEPQPADQTDRPGIDPGDKKTAPSESEREKTRPQFQDPHAAFLEATTTPPPKAADEPPSEEPFPSKEPFPSEPTTSKPAPEREPVLAKAKREEAKPEVALSKPDAGSLEMKLGTYWFVRIGVILLLTGAGILAYYKKQFFFDLSPLTKVVGLYVLSALMGGIGFWLQRTKEKLKNYGQVLVAGGFSGVYFTTYAAHIFEPVQIIPNPSVALLLLLAWGGFMVWVADRLKSETVALFAIGASYYATYVPLIHAGAISNWVILASNLILAVAAVVFMLRNRWLKMPVLSMAAAYTGFFLWRSRVLDEPSLALVLLFGCSLWAVYTAAVFLSRAKDFKDLSRATFLTANNAALFGLLTLEMLRNYEDHYWVLPLSFGAVLIACALASAKWLKDQPRSRNSFLTQGLVLAALGIMATNLSQSLKGPIFAAESVVLLLMGIRRKHQILQIGSLIAAAIAAVYGLRDVSATNPDHLGACLTIGVFLLFNAWLSHRRLEADDPTMLRPRVSLFTALGLATALVAFITHRLHAPEHEWMSAILLAATGLFAASVYALRLREFVILGLAPAAMGLLFSLDLAEHTSGFGWPLLTTFALTLGLAHWWRWQGKTLTACCPDQEAQQLPLIAEVVFSAGAILQLLTWLHADIGLGDEWLVIGSLLAAGAALYGAFTRAPFVAALGQVFLAIACFVQVKLCLDGSGDSAIKALLPIATMLLTNLALPIVASRFDRAPEALRLGFGKIQTGYRIAASALGLLWIYHFVPSDYRVLVIVAIGGAFLLARGWRPTREWLGLALAYLVASIPFLVTQFANDLALWQSLVAIVGLLGLQQLIRRREGLQIPPKVHVDLILGGGVALFFWATIKVSASMPVGDGNGLRSIVWAVLAVIYFTLGLKLRERWYRLMGLGTLGIALVSLFPIIWQMSTEMKIASFFVLGLVFVGLGFVYNRNKEQIRKLL